LNPALVAARQNLDAARRRLRDQQFAQVHSLAAAGRYKISELAGFGLEGGSLSIAWSPRLRAEHLARVEVSSPTAGPNTMWTAFTRVPVAFADPGPIQQVSLSRYDFDQFDGEGVWYASVSTTVESAPGRPAARSTFVTAQYGLRGALYRMQYVQSASSATLLVYAAVDPLNPEPAKNPAAFAGGGRFRRAPSSSGYYVQYNSRASTLLGLYADDAAAVCQYLVPVLRLLAGENPLRPGATDVYWMFPGIEPDAAALAAVRALLPRLGDASFAVRQSASVELASLGRAGVLASLRLLESEGAALNYEQRHRLRAFLAAHSRRDLSGVAPEGRARAALLLDCLEDEDAAVRRAAKAALESARGREIDLNPMLLPAGQFPAIEALRREILAPLPRP